MFVGDQDGGEIFRHPTDALKAFADLTRGKTGVHEDAGFGRLDVGAIAGRAAAEDGEFDGHKRKLRRKAENARAKYFWWGEAPDEPCGEGSDLSLDGLRRRSPHRN